MRNLIIAATSIVFVMFLFIFIGMATKKDFCAGASGIKVHDKVF